MESINFDEILVGRTIRQQAKTIAIKNVDELYRGHSVDQGMRDGAIMQEMAKVEEELKRRHHASSIYDRKVLDSSVTLDTPAIVWRVRDGLSYSDAINMINDIDNDRISEVFLNNQVTVKEVPEMKLWYRSPSLALEAIKVGGITGGILKSLLDELSMNSTFLAEKLDLPVQKTSAWLKHGVPDEYATQVKALLSNEHN